jgi:hypothetical protein
MRCLVPSIPSSVINLKTAKALSLKIHPQPLAMADRGDRVKCRDVRYWRIADNPTAPEFVRFWTIADKA